MESGDNSDWGDVVLIFALLAFGLCLAALDWLVHTFTGRRIIPRD